MTVGFCLCAIVVWAFFVCAFIHPVTEKLTLGIKIGLHKLFSTFRTKQRSQCFTSSNWFFLTCPLPISGLLTIRVPELVSRVRRVSLSARRC
jgi:hypothetical protein